MDDDQVELVRRLLSAMREKAHPQDRTAHQLIKKYERLLREELMRRG